MTEQHAPHEEFTLDQRSIERISAALAENVTMQDAFHIYASMPNACRSIPSTTQGADNGG